MQLLSCAMFRRQGWLNEISGECKIIQIVRARQKVLPLPNDISYKNCVSKII
jgi:hypothetical protein